MKSPNPGTAPRRVHRSRLFDPERAERATFSLQDVLSAKGGKGTPQHLRLRRVRAGDAAPVILTVRETAAILRVSTATVYAMVERRELAHVRVSNAIRIVVEAPTVEERPQADTQARFCLCPSPNGAPCGTGT